MTRGLDLPKIYNMSKLTRNTFTAAQAKSHFADSLRAAEEGGVVVITRYGKPVAALVHFSELEDLERLRNQSSQEGLGGLTQCPGLRQNLWRSSLTTTATRSAHRRC